MDRKTSLTSGQSSSATAGPSGASHDRTAADAGRGGRAEAACPNNGGRSADATAGGPPCAEVASKPPAAAGGAAAPAPPLGAAAAPAWRGGFRHSRPSGSYGCCKPGGKVGRAGTGGRALVGPGVAGAGGDCIAPDAASAADGLARGTTGGTSARTAPGRIEDAADGAPPGLSGGVAGDGSISAEEDVVLWEPGNGGGAAGGAPEVRRKRRGVVGADHVGLGRNGDSGPAYERMREPAKRRAWPRRRRGVRVAAAGERGRRQPTGRHAAVAARCARNGHSHSSAMIVSGDFVCMEGIICIGW